MASSRARDEKRWVYGLFRKDETEGIQKASSYISDNLDGDELIISKPVLLTSDKGETKEVRAYTTFTDYISLYSYIKARPLSERQFHEVCPSNHKQKPKFDIDIDLPAYREFAYVGMSFEQLGEYVKDMVIRAAIAVLKAYNVAVDISRDICIFTSHGMQKRSYHVLLSRYYHFSNEQAREFYELCSRVHVGELDQALFARFVDSHVYAANASLRVSGCVKPGSDRVKRYCSDFTYEGATYSHLLTDPKAWDGRPVTDRMREMLVLSHSLVTFCEGLTAMPVFAVARKVWEREVEEISPETYDECKAFLATWDIQGAYEIDGESEGKIQLPRVRPSYCESCKRVHHEMPGFAHIIDGVLYVHCGRCSGIGRRVGSLSSVADPLQSQIMLHTARLTVSTGVQHTYIGGSTEVTEPEPEPFSLVFTSAGGDIKRAHDIPEIHRLGSTADQSYTKEDEEQSLPLATPIEQIWQIPVPIVPTLIPLSSIACLVPSSVSPLSSSSLPSITCPVSSSVSPPISSPSSPIVKTMAYKRRPVEACRSPVVVPKREDSFAHQVRRAQIVTPVSTVCAQPTAVYLPVARRRAAVI